jgi:2-oxoisovalerate dehydrogenase E2 component (dihydrolipoyl transacylase)
MGIETIILPDVGEGIAEAELTEWQVQVGDVVKEDDILGVVMTDKAAIEVPSAMDGKVTWLAGNVGDVIAIGSPFVKMEVAGSLAVPEQSPIIVSAPKNEISRVTFDRRSTGDKPQAAPSVRKRAMDVGADLYSITGTGPNGRIMHDDLDRYLARNAPAEIAQDDDVTEIKVTGMRRKIAEKMVLSKSTIPHITIVEEVDMTNLENLRQTLNAKYVEERVKLTILPFIMRAISNVVEDQPQMNAHYDDKAEMISQYKAVHIGIATQTPNGLTVPVVKNAETKTLWDAASTMAGLAERARNGTASRDDLTGSTITITSLGALGAIASTPIINHPEVAIVGINKMAMRPMWDGHDFQPRKMMNISCSFDHRVIDGWDAATFVHEIKTLLETPALLFIEG